VARLLNLQSELVRVEHSHGNNQWGSMEEVRDPAQTDEERQWSRHRIFRCNTCEEEIRIEVPEPGRQP
jgi:hypothetical protein